MVALIAELAAAAVSLFHAIAGLLTTGKLVFDTVVVPVLWLVAL